MNGHGVLMAEFEGKKYKRIMEGINLFLSMQCKRLIHVDYIEGKIVKTKSSSLAQRNPLVCSLP